MKTKHLRLMQRVYIILFFCFMYLPIAYMIVFSFNQSKGYSLFTGFTLKWYSSLLHNSAILHALLVSLEVALISAVIATVLGTAASLGIASMGRKSRLVVTNITYIPVVNPEIITGISLMLLFVFFAARMNLEFGFVTLVIAHITFDVPYVILNVMPKFRQMDPNLFEAAQDLGCSPFTALRKVILPEIMPGVVSGFLMSFTFSLDDFVISYFTSGSTSQTLPITIYSMTRRKISPEINALSTLIFVVVVIVLMVKHIIETKQEQRNRANGGDEE